ncbi:hypothetical protein WJX84_008455, partial [Apatococcus fuscideae]
KVVHALLSNATSE